MPTLGSLFDGIGGFPLAAVRNGIEPSGLGITVDTGMDLNKIVMK